MLTLNLVLPVIEYEMSVDPVSTRVLTASRLLRMRCMAMVIGLILLPQAAVAEKTDKQDVLALVDAAMDVEKRSLRLPDW